MIGGKTKIRVIYADTDQMGVVYYTRYFEFFDHYLKGAPAPTWMTDGVPYLVKESSRE